MIRLKGFQAWRWRNRFADHPVAVADIELDSATSWSVDQLAPDALAALGERFGEVAARDLSAQGLAAAICLSLQQQKYGVPPACGATASQFWFAAADPVYASVTAGAAVAVINEIVGRPQMTAADIARSLDQFVDRCEFAALDQSTRAMVAEAERRGIPWFRLNPGTLDVQLGHGRRTSRIRETMRSNESLLAAGYAGNKTLTLSLLSAAGLPVGRFAAARDPEQAVAAASEIGFPVVLKPVSGSKGAGVIIGLTGPDAVREAARTLLAAAPQIVVQSVLPGDDHRLLVVDGRLIAAARREPAAVVGDGESSLSRLIEIANRDPRRGTGFSKLMNLIAIDDELRRVVADQGLAPDSVPPAGLKVRLRLTANISTGGAAVDVTDAIHPDNAWLAVRATAIIGLTVAGVDFLTPDITRSWREVGGGVCELNVGVGLRPHWLADPSRDVVGPIMDTLFPPGADGRIPTALITGSNGKTTTTRMLDHILRAAGHVVGAATTDGVTIDGRTVVEGDYAGSSGAAIVLGDPQVTAATLETARGGVLKWGIGLDRCTVAALLNVDREQVGMDGIETLDDMARLKRKVVETARGAVVFNAEDTYSLAVSRDFPIARTILFSLDASAPAVGAHLAAGGTVVTLADADGRETIVIRGPAAETGVLETAAIPATFGGRVRHNVANALAAAALAHGMGVAAGIIATGLAGFTPSLEHSQGRFNFIDDLPARVLFDFASNPPALATAVRAMAQFPVEGRRIVMVTGVGDRPDSHGVDSARAVAHHFDHYVCFEMEPYRRGRPPGDIAARLAAALAAAGVPPDRIVTHLSEDAALTAAAQMAAPGDLLVIFGTYVQTALPLLRSAFDRAGAPRDPEGTVA